MKEQYAPCSACAEPDIDIGRCDWCGGEDGPRRRTQRGWLCIDCRLSVKAAS